MKPCVTETVQWSVSAPALRLLISSGSDRVQSISMVGSEMLRLCLSTWGLCCFFAASSRPGSLSPTPRLSVCQVLLCAETFAVNCLCFLSFFHLPKHFSLSLSMFLFITPSLCSFPSLSVHLHLAPPLCHLYLSDSTRINSPSHPPAFAVLLRPTEAIRTDGLRWFPGSTHFYRKQPGTAAGMMLSQGVRRSNNIIIQSAKS